MTAEPDKQDRVERWEDKKKNLSIQQQEMKKSININCREFTKIHKSMF